MHAMPIDDWGANSTWKNSLVCAWPAEWLRTTPSAGTEIAGDYCGKTFVRGFVELRSRSNGGWTEAIGCATEAAICTCGPAQNRCGRPQVLPAYGLQDLRNKHQDPKPKSNPNTMYLQTTLGENHGSGHFYLAKTRTFLLCVDSIQSCGAERAGADRRKDPNVQVRFRFVRGWNRNTPACPANPTAGSR